MKNYKEIVQFEECKHKTNSIYGNPSYWLWYTDSDNIVQCGYTGSDCACGYGIRNYKPGDKIEITYHYTKSGNIIITYIKDII